MTVIRLSQAASRLGLCTATLRSMVRRGELRAVKLGARWLGFEVTEIDRFIEARRIVQKPRAA